MSNTLRVYGLEATAAIKTTGTDFGGLGYQYVAAGRFSNESQLTNNNVGADAYGIIVENSATTPYGSKYGGTFSVSGSAVQNIGVWARASGGTYNYGLYTDVTASSSNNNYSIYSAGTAKSYIAGNLGIGTTTPETLLSVTGTSTLQNIIPGGHTLEICLTSVSVLQMLVGVRCGLRHTMSVLQLGR